MTARVLITAGAAGIGHAMATAFAATGARVWVADSDAAALAACPQEWQRTTLDVTDEGGMRALFGDIEAKWGGLDVLCANAGISGPTAPVEDVDLADWRACIAVNLDGAFLAAKYAAPLMKAQGGGAIILTSSAAGMALSTTHVATGSILGSGLGRKGAEVRWGVAGRMALAWLTTLPAAAVVGAVSFWIAHSIGGAAGAITIFVILAALSGWMWWRAQQQKVDSSNVNAEWDDTTNSPVPAAIETDVVDIEPKQQA